MCKIILTSAALLFFPAYALLAAPATSPATAPGVAATGPAPGVSQLPEKITPATPPTPELAQGLFDVHRYDDAIRIINRLIQMNPVTAKYDRQAMLTLRVECHLCLKQTKAALDTLEAIHLTAEKAADRDQDSRAVALKYLVQSSPGLAYVPSTGANKTPIPIVDMLTRGSAFDALYADQLAKLEQRVSDATATASINGILDIAKAAQLLRAIGFVAKGDAKQIDESMKALPGLAANRMKDAFDKCDRIIGDISNSANRLERRQTGITTGSNGTYNNYKEYRFGLTGQDVATLRDIESTCDRIPQAIADLVNAFGDPEAYDNRRFKAQARATEVRKHADDVLTKDYTR